MNQDPQADTRPLRSAIIVSIGDELTLGEIADTNAAWLARRLTALGLRVTRHLTLPDDLPELTRHLRAAADEVDLLLITGGLGPTDDDLTRQALADAAGVPLESSPSALEQIREFFALRGRPMPDANRRQACLPRGGVSLPNRCGTAPGIRLALARATCYALPGVPFEMRDMFERLVLPELTARAAGEVLIRRTLRCAGLPEDRLAPLVARWMHPGANPAVGTTAGMGLIDIRIRARASDGEAAARLIAPVEHDLRKALGDKIFGTDEDTLAAVVGRLLAERRQTLTTAESCTGGLLAKLITDVPGASRYYLGGAITYDNRLKQQLLDVSAELLREHGAVSEPVARAMAGGGARRFGSTFCLATTGIAGPSGGTPTKPVGTVHIALATPEQIQAVCRRYDRHAPREAIRLRAAYDALDLLRHQLAEVSAPTASRTCR